MTGGSNTNTYFAFNFSPNTGRFNIYLNTGSAVWSPQTPENLIEYTKWNHVALVKHSNVVKLYVNGLAIGSYSHSGQVGYSCINYNHMSNRWWWKQFIKCIYARYAYL